MRASDSGSSYVETFWPRIMANTIQACERAETELIFFDNVYMYGKVAGPMTETLRTLPAQRRERDPRKDRNRPAE